MMSRIELTGIGFIPELTALMSRIGLRGEGQVFSSLEKILPLLTVDKCLYINSL
jgi:hypothetical protein